MMTAEQKAKMTTVLTSLVGNETDQLRVEFILNAVVDYILSYCHLDKLPDKLVNVAILMATDALIDLNMQTKAPDQLGEAKSLTEGDFTIQAFTLADMTAAMAGLSSKSYLKKYYKQLNACRKLP